MLLKIDDCILDELRSNVCIVVSGRFAVYCCSDLRRSGVKVELSAT